MYSNYYYSSSSYRSASDSNGRSGGRNRFQTSSKPGRDIMKDLDSSGAQLLRRPSGLDDGDIKCRHVTYVASYNWVTSETPTILVPGSPGVWRESMRLPFRVPGDSGLVYIDQNGDRLPSYPLLPLFRAADIMEKRAGEAGGAAMDWRSVDVVSDRNNLRKLLSYLGSSVRDDFRIDIELAGNTLILQRWEPRTSEVVTEGRGFGHSFEAKCTSTPSGLENWKSTGHHRVITYKLGGMQFVVRFEVDACYAPRVAAPARGNDADDLASVLSTLRVSGGSSTRRPANAQTTEFGVTVIEAGTVVSQSSLIELKTRSARNVDSFDWNDAYPQLYLGQTPTSIIGVHRSGEFFERRTRQLDSPEMAVVARNAQSRLKQLVELLEQIRGLVRQRPGVKRTLVYKDCQLKLVERTSPASLLPAAVLRRFDAGVRT